MAANAPSLQRRPDVAFWVAFGVCAAAALLPLLVTYRLPMTDLPQHAAQITFWKHYSDPCYRFDLQYEKNWFTPYLGGYALARLFASIVSVNAAFKIVIALYIITLALTSLMLARRVGVDHWLSLLAFPLAYGFSFYWGFVNTLVALPLSVVFVALAYDYARESTVRRGVAVGVLALLIPFVHALLFAACFVAAVLMLCWSLRRDFRRLLPALLPYLAPLPVLALWWQRVGGHERMRMASFWALTPTRLIRFFSDLLSAGWDPAGAVVAILLMIVAALAGLRPSRDPRRWIPAAVFALSYFLGPLALRGTTFINQRFAVLFVIALLLAFDSRPPLLRVRLVHSLMVIVVLAWSVVLIARFVQFQRESQDFDRLVDRMPTNARVLYLDYAPGSAAIPAYPYFQYAAYYQERKGGLINWSFANNFQVIMRYRPGAEIRTTRSLYQNPRLFRWGTNDSRYDFFLVRAPVDLQRVIFAEATEPVVLDGQVGWWWLYRRASAKPASPCPPLVPDGDVAHRPVIDFTG
jgi:hypothetical protein